MDQFEKPWQAMPSRIISLALAHAEQTTDFDHQLAFLLLDVGVETSLKTYLINRKIDVEKIVFPELLKRVRDEIAKNNLQLPLDDIQYFHNVRNKLYHEGDGVKPTKDNLKRYSELAVNLLKILLNVDVRNLPPSEYNSEYIEENIPYYRPVRVITYNLFNFDEPLSAYKLIGQSVDSIKEKSLYMIENLYPQIATSIFVKRLGEIRDKTGPDREAYPLSLRAEMRQQRVELFNRLTGWEFTYDPDNDEEGVGDYTFIEYIIDNPEQIYVWLAFQELSRNDYDEDWKEYKDAVDLLSSKYYKDDIVNGKMKEKMEKILFWAEERREKIIAWLNEHIPSEGW